jgi:hypothetical protein
VLLGPAGIHAEQHLGPVLRLGAALPRLDLEVAVVAVGLAREEALELALGDLAAQLLERALGLGEDRLVALSLGELDEPQLVRELALDLAVAADRAIEPVALAQQRLRLLRPLPELGVLGLGVQLVEPPRRVVPVKDASSAGPRRL